MTTSGAAHKPSDLDAQYRGETRAADGYQYWTTSVEDEEALDIRDQVESGAYDADEEKRKKKAARRKLLPAGAWRRTGIRLASMILIAALAALAYFGFTYFQVSGSASTDQTQPADAIIVLGPAQASGAPSYVLQERLDHAFNLYSDGIAPKIVVTGGTAEAHLQNKGVPDEDIRLISDGSNSWEQLSAANAVIQSNQFDTVLLVSDSYHNYRLEAIASELDIEAFVSPSAIEPDMTDYLRESVTVSIGRIAGYSGVGDFTEDG